MRLMTRYRWFHQMLGATLALLLPAISQAESPTALSSQPAPDEARNGGPPAAPEAGSAASPADAKLTGDKGRFGFLTVGVTAPSTGFTLELWRFQGRVMQGSLFTLSCSLVGVHCETYAAMGIGGLGVHSGVWSEDTEVGFITFPISFVLWGPTPKGWFAGSSSWQTGKIWYGAFLTKMYARYTPGVIAFEAGLEAALIWGVDPGGLYSGLPPFQTYFAVGLAFDE